jgi:2,4-dienoyl-CoA reductase-like NADH-dependent reductase (Old Yellow Enzyme family)
MVAPWLREEGSAKSMVVADQNAGGWPDDVVGASAIPFGEAYAIPREMSLQEIAVIVDAFRESARRSVEAGMDVIEIHGAHGYLICSFMSPISNKRTDQYGGRFENRIRLLVEIVKAIRDVIPKGMPLLVRVSATEWMEKLVPESWTVDDTIRLAKLLPALGVDLLDVSSGSNNEKQEIPIGKFDYQTGIAGRIRDELFKVGIKDLLIGAVGMITEAEVARSLVENGTEGSKAGEIEIEDETSRSTKADIVLVARQFLREPEWVLRVAFRLGVKVQW